jgi:hypothetical protein
MEFNSRVARDGFCCVVVDEEQKKQQLQNAKEGTATIHEKAITEPRQLVDSTTLGPENRQEGNETFRPDFVQMY